MISPEAPFLILGFMGLFAGGLAIFLPETAGTKLPDTVADVERSGTVGSRKEATTSKMEKKPILNFNETTEVAEVAEAADVGSSGEQPILDAVGNSVPDARGQTEEV